MLTEIDLCLRQIEAIGLYEYCIYIYIYISHDLLII